MYKQAQKSNTSAIMKVRDKTLGELVDVCDKECPTLKCYWARPDPGVFNIGQGYRQRSAKVGYICGTREIKGCPDFPEIKTGDL